jgi:hypothetical protein
MVNFLFFFFPDSVAAFPSCPGAAFRCDESMSLHRGGMSAGAELEASAQRERELRKIVLAWLNKKGYTKAEEQFRLEAEIAGVEQGKMCILYLV